MGLSDREKQILQELEQQFPVSGMTARVRGVARRLGPWADRIGWFLIVGGVIGVFALLASSVIASFAAFLVAIVGLGLVIQGSVGRGLRRRLGQVRGQNGNDDSRNGDTPSPDVC